MEEILARYKALEVYARVGIVVLVSGLIFWSCSVSSKISSPSSQLSDAQQAFDSKNAERTRMEEREKTIDSSADIEKQKIDLERKIQRQLQNNSNMLPDQFHIDNVMSALSRLAKHHNVKILSFNMGDEREMGDEFRYYEMPIELEITGHYSSCGYFYGGIIALGVLVQMRDIKINHHMMSRETEDRDYDDKSSEADSSRNPSAEFGTRLMTSLQNYMVKSESTFVIFRSS